MKLQKEWEQRLKLHAEGNKLHAEGNKLHAEGSKLRAEGDRLWAEAILKAYGKNIKIEWKNWNKKYNSYECHLENGEVYKSIEVMAKSNKVLEALQRVRERIETDVVHLKRSDKEYEIGYYIEYYDAKRVKKVLSEEINKAIRLEEESSYLSDCTCADMGSEKGRDPGCPYHRHLYREFTVDKGAEGYRE